VIHENIERQVEEMFREAEDAHRAEISAAAGEDPEWPLWYAERLRTGLSDVLAATFTKSELIYMLVLAEKQRESEAPGSNRARFWAGFFVDRYV
jgi:hypothetical protein